jgi:hypothetical protein
MKRIDVELELRLHITNLCLAVASKEAGMLRECKDLLVDKVQELIAAAEKERDHLEIENERFCMDAAEQWEPDEAREDLLWQAGQSKSQSHD